MRDGAFALVGFRLRLSEVNADGAFALVGVRLRLCEANADGAFALVGFRLRLFEVNADGVFTLVGFCLRLFTAPPAKGALSSIACRNLSYNYALSLKDCWDGHTIQCINGGILTVSNPVTVAHYFSYVWRCN